MALVRELINRISFKINPADKKNLDDFTAKMNKSFFGLISNAKKIGLGLASAIGIGGRQILSFEKQISETEFFSRSVEEAKRIREIFAQIAKDNDAISKIQAQSGAAIISQLNISTAQVKTLAPLLDKIDRARNKLDFKDVSLLLSQAVGGASGDIDALKALIPGIKNLAELIRKSNFGKPFGDLTEQLRLKVVLDQLIAQQERLNDLGKERNTDLQRQVDIFQNLLSDIFTPGKKMNEFFTRMLSSVNVLLTSLRRGQLFTPEEFKAQKQKDKEKIKSIIKPIRDIKLPSFRGRTQRNEKSRERMEVRRQENIEDVGNFLKSLFPFGSETKTETTLTPNNQGKTNGDEGKSINVSVNGTIRVEGANGMEISQMSSELTERIFSEFKTGLNNVRAQNGEQAVGIE